MKRSMIVVLIIFLVLILGGLVVLNDIITVQAAPLTQAASPTPVTPAGQVGPNLDQFPAGINPLTGKPAANPDDLKLPALLVSLANFPPSARPLTGLSYAPQVYEIYITEGMTRFLTVFYGDLPKAGASAQATPLPGSTATPGAVTPAPTPAPVIGGFENPGDMVSGVRSGREAYVPIVNAFPNGCLVAASKSAAVKVNICRNVYGRDANNINSAGLTFDQMEALAKANANPNRPVNYSGNVFNASAPAGGKPAAQVDVFYSWLNQAQWKYDAAAQTYMRYEDFGTADKAGQFRPSTDRLTGDPVHFENIVVLFVDHVARTPTIIDLNMGVGNQGRAVVFRDGQVYTGLQWSMLNGEYERSTGLARPLRLINADGTPFALAPGHTWYHVATTFSSVWATDATKGVWKYRFYAPAGAAK